jgi:hypothetical protein
VDAFEKRADIEWSGRLAEPLEPCARDVWDRSGYKPCLSTIGEIRKKRGYRGLGLYCENGHMRPQQYLSHEDLLPDAKYGSAGVPLHYLSAEASKRRKNEYRFKDSVRLAAHSARSCLWCGIEPAPSNTRSAFDWLRIRDRALFEQVARSLGELVMGRADVSDLWLQSLPADLRAIVQLRFDDSQLQADHILPVDLLKEAKDRLPLNVFNYAARELGAPCCAICNRGRKLNPLADEALIEEKVIAHFFKTRKTAEQSPKYAMFQEALAQCVNAASRIKRGKASRNE